MRRNIFVWVLFSLFLGFSFLEAQDVPTPESELTESSFPPLPIEPEILSFPDADFARIGLKIQLGTASIQERRAWYRAAERYAPFQNAPPAGWKVKASEAGKKLDKKPGSSTTIYNWVSLGPNGDYDVSGTWGPTGALDQGRSTAVWTHMAGPTIINRNIIYLGFADGGVWKTTDGGENWTALTDFQPTTAVGALDVLPRQDVVNYSDAIIYVGTGEGNFSQPDKDGVGVLKSVDGGQTWTVQQIPWRTDALNFAGLHRIRRLRIDPNIPNAQNIWIAADGGVYRTTDGGSTWALVTGLPFSGAPAGSAFPGGCWNEFATDFAIDSVNLVNGNSILYAVFGNIRNSVCDPSADSRKNNGVYRSTDGGTTWKKITQNGANGFTTIPGDVGRMSLMMAPTNPKHLYVQIAKASDFTSLGIWDTLDAAADNPTWTAQNNSSQLTGYQNYVGSQGWYDMTGAVSPVNENHVIVGGIDNWISFNRGRSLTKISGWSASDETWAHADHHHAIWIDKNTFYDANDGGLNIGNIPDNATQGTPGVTWTHRNGGGLSTLQFYGLSQSAQTPNKINAGLQDNGHAYFDGIKWRSTFGGDGGFAATNQDDENEAYEEYVYASIRNSDDGGQTWPTTGCMQAFGTPICTGCLGACIPDNHTAFIANFMLDVHNQNVMYVGTNYLYRNTDAKNAGKIWQKITTDGINGDFVKGATSSRAYISIVHTPQSSPFNGNPAISQIIYVGTSTGRIWKTTNGGTTWTDLTKAPLPVVSDIAGRFVTWIDTDPTNSNNVVISYSGWNNSTNPAIPGHVFRSLDGGASWVDISGALPDEPYNSVAVNPNAGKNGEIYVASDTSVYVNTSGWSGNTWIRTNSGLLPHVSVNMLQFTNATTPKRLRAASHGRGIWELFTECKAIVTVDKPVYGCSDTVKITVQDQIQTRTSQVVTIFSGADPIGETVTLNETPLGSGHYVGTIELTGSTSSTDGKLTVYNVDDITVSYNDKTPCPGGARKIETTAKTNCNTCDAPASTAKGSNMEASTTPGGLNITSGDGDEFLDNCESATASFTVRNIGAGNLTKVRISSVSSSNPNITVATPVSVAATLGQCQSKPASFSFTGHGLSPNETLEFNVQVTSDELAAKNITRSVLLRYTGSEQDFTFQSSKTFTFENSAEGWEVVRGTFDRTTLLGTGANATSSYFASSSLTDGVCDEIRSPIVKLSPTSTMTLFNQYQIEPINDAWYDRANVGIVDANTGNRTVVSPSSGRIYLADGPNGVCVTGGQPGWAGPGPGWLPSIWNAADLNSASFAGKKVYVDVAYGTDPLASGTGFWFDEVTLTNFSIQGPDANTCQ